MSVEYDELHWHMQICQQCFEAFTQYHDYDYCELGKPLFERWHSTAKPVSQD